MEMFYYAYALKNLVSIFFMFTKCFLLTYCMLCYAEGVMAVQASLREDIVKLLVYSVNTPAPNIAHLLLGYDITKPLQDTILQDPGECVCICLCLCVVFEHTICAVSPTLSIVM